MADLNRSLRELGIVGADETDADLVWSRLPGGYHNDVSVVGTRQGNIVVKHFVADSGNPLYPQLPTDEFRALQHLAGTGLAPEPLGYIDDVDGRALLAYRFIAGEMWAADRARVADVGAMLRRLHDLPVPAGFRSLPSGRGVLDHCQAILRDVPTPQRLASHLQLLGSVDAVEGGERSLVHTDCGPGNIVVGDDGPCLIDWQCPGIGHPVEDISNFASAAIQILYHQPPLTDSATAELIDGYGGGVAADAFHRLRWAYHARIAAYCSFRAAQLAANQPDVAELYRQALAAELELLDTRP